MNAKQRWGQTALMHAAREGHAAIVIYLLESGADVKLKDKNGDTALNIANDNDNLDVVTILKRAGAKAELKKVVQPPVDDDDDDDDDIGEIDVGGDDVDDLKRGSLLSILSF